MRNTFRFLAYKLTFAVLFLCVSFAVKAEPMTPPDDVADKVVGVVVDAETGDSMAYVKLQYKGYEKSYMTSVRGEFSIPRYPKQQLEITAFGYKPVHITVGSKSTQKLKIRMKPDLTNLGTVEVTGKKTKYSRKENPAVELMKRVIERNKANNLKTNHEYFRYNKYQKLTLAQNDIDPDSVDAEGKKTKKQYVLNQMMYCPQNGKYVLPINYEETVTECLYRRRTDSERNTLIGKHGDGLLKEFEMGDNVNQLLDDMFRDVDIFKNNVEMLLYKFISPIGSDAISFYRYFIADTLTVGEDKCIKLAFLPNNPQDFGFSGNIFVLADSTLHVRRCELTIPEKSDVNWVSKMKIDLEYEKLSTGEWALSKDDMFCELTILAILPKAAVFRTTRRVDYDFTPIPDEKFSGMGVDRVAEGVDQRDSTFWAEHRVEKLTVSEENMHEYVKAKRKSTGFGIFVTGAKIFLENYIPLGNRKHPAKVDFGPLNTLVSRNFYDGVRTRISFATRSELSRHFFANGYITKGWGGVGDGLKLYGGGELTYSFNKKDKTPDEYPKRKIYFKAAYDNMAPSDRFSVHDKDNIFTMFKWSNDSLRLSYTQFKLGFDYEQYGGLEYKAHYRWEDQKGLGGLMGQDMVISELCGELRYAPGEKVITTKERRIKVNRNTPVFELSHTAGIKGFLGGTQNYNTTDLSAYYRLYLKSWGRLTMFGKAEMQWNKVPYLLLLQPRTNTSLVVQRNTFNQLRDMEFLNDRQVMWDLEWDLNGKIFNRIPLLKRLKWREYLGFRGLWGALSDKNRPMYSDNPWLDDNNQIVGYKMYDSFGSPWPHNSHVMDGTKPYMEFMVGIHNILNVFGVEYVRRITYTDRNVHGVRFRFEMSF